MPCGRGYSDTAPGGPSRRCPGGLVIHTAATCAISIVIPTRSGAPLVDAVVPGILQALAGRESVEIVVVDDGSSRTHRRALHELATAYRGTVRLVELQRRRGQVYATLAGVYHARGQWIITMDDDGAHPPGAVPQVLDRLRGTPPVDLVYGVPLEAGRPAGTPGVAAVRRLGSAANRWLFRRWLRLPRHIPVGSFRGFSRELAQRALATPVRYHYLSAMLLNHRPAVGAVPCIPGPPGDGDSRGPRGEPHRTRHTVVRLVAVLGALMVFWGPGRLLGAVVRRRKVFRPMAPAIMILGGGSSQEGILKRARDTGFFVVLADRDPGAPGRRYAHRFVQASTFDPPAVAAGAARARVQRIIAAGSDQPVLTAARAAHRLGLAHPLTVEEARAVTHKGVMKARFRHAGIPTMPWVVLREDPAQWDHDALAALGLPWVVKPVDSQGQRGIRVVHNRHQLEAHLPEALRHSRCREVVVEQYYQSREVTVSGWAHGGARQPVEIWAITDRITFDPRHAVSHGGPIGVCLAHRYPAEGLSSFRETVVEVTERIVQAFNLADVPIYFQMLVGPEGVRVNEIACRLGGAYEDLSLPPVAGVDIQARQLGWDAPVEKSARCCAVPLIFARRGTVARLAGDAAVRRLPGVTDCRFLLPRGTVIRPMENSTQRIAYAVLHGDTPEAVNNLLNTVFDTLRAEDHAGTNLLVDTRAETMLASGV